MTSPVETALAVVPANQTASVGVAFLDRKGDGSSLAAMHAPLDTTGARIDPATSERQDATNTALAAISGQLPASLGQKSGAQSLPVVLSSDGPFTTYATQIGSQADAAATSDAGTFSLFALVKRALGYLGQLAGTVSSGALLTAIKSNAPRVTATGSLGAVNATVSLAVDGMATCVAQISGAFVGSVSWFASIDGGVTYFSIAVTPLGAAGGAPLSVTTAVGDWEFSAAGYTHIAAQMTAYTSGSASVILAAANGPKIVRVKAPATDPLPVISPLAAPVTGQVKIATTGQAVQLPAAALVNGILVKAKSTNAAQSGSYSGTVGAASSITTTYDGTGGGYPLAPGEAASFACSNANFVYVNGTAGDVFSFQGN